MLPELKHFLRSLMVVYSCISLSACMTPRAIEYAAGIGETETRLWSVDAITFAAIRDDRYVRICVSLSGPAGATESELLIDLQRVAEQLSSQDEVVGGLKDGVNTESSLCGLELEVDEQRLPVSVVHSDAADVAEALQAFDQSALERPAAGLLHFGAESYLVFAIQAGMYDGLDRHALGPYTEVVQHYHPSIFLLQPIAVAFDAALVAGMIVLIIPCLIPIFLPLCIPIAIVAGAIENTDPGSYEDWQSEDEEDLFE